MTRSDLLALSPYDREGAVQKAWSAQNDAGNGFPADDLASHYREIEIGLPANSGSLISREQSMSSAYRLYDDDIHIVATADANGPWAIVVTREDVDADEIDSDR